MMRSVGAAVIDEWPRFDGLTAEDDVVGDRENWMSMKC